ncbi:hypothetical protein R1sor_012461 [Riccia sorocarpa]|uniref:Endonuclease/exonuclease/phosphatase domain-containing protein n=1 Tax=Riccia sorocarpa TaxID=122646 RepID=A0ABD3I3V0_9MARC
MVENTRDSIGPSPVLKGRELRSWTLCSNQGDLIDGWLTALDSNGPWFTRQAVHGLRLDQSRLDRLYISNRGEWIEVIRTVEHQGASSLSDHVPIGAVLVLEKKNRAEDRRKTVSYFKMRASLFTRPEVMQEAEEEWRKHPVWAKDERKRALEIGVSDGICERRGRQVEDIEHIFWHCRTVIHQREGLKLVGAIPRDCNGLLEWIDSSLALSNRNTAHLNLLTNFTDAIWRERNQRVFQRQDSRLPLSELLNRTYRDIDAYPGPRTNDKTLEMLLHAKSTVERWKLTWERRGAEDMENENGRRRNNENPTTSLGTNTEEDISTESTDESEASSRQHGDSFSSVRLEQLNTAAAFLH